MESRYLQTCATRQGCTTITLEDGGHLVYLPDFYTREQADGLFTTLQVETPWENHGNPRLVNWVGEFAYAYANIRHPAAPWTDCLAVVREEVERLVFGQSARQYQGVLLNLYRDGQDGVGFHADNEASILVDSPIASISLGAEREFVLNYRGKTQPKPRQVRLTLKHGSCVIMGGTIQRHWLHSIPKTVQPIGPRVNLTFRQYQF